MFSYGNVQLISRDDVLGLDRGYFSSFSVSGYSQTDEVVRLLLARIIVSLGSLLFPPSPPKKAHYRGMRMERRHFGAVRPHLRSHSSLCRRLFCFRSKGPGLLRFRSALREKEKQAIIQVPTDVIPPVRSLKAIWLRSGGTREIFAVYLSRIAFRKDHHLANK